MHIPITPDRHIERLRLRVRHDQAAEITKFDTWLNVHHLATASRLHRRDQTTPSLRNNYSASSIVKFYSAPPRFRDVFRARHHPKMRRIACADLTKMSGFALLPWSINFNTLVNQSRRRASVVLPRPQVARLLPRRSQDEGINLSKHFVCPRAPFFEIA